MVDREFLNVMKNEFKPGAIFGFASSNVTSLKDHASIMLVLRDSSKNYSDSVVIYDVCKYGDELLKSVIPTNKRVWKRIV
jgi:hypothetical protein